VALSITENWLKRIAGSDGTVMMSIRSKFARDGGGEGWGGGVLHVFYI